MTLNPAVLWAAENSSCACAMTTDKATPAGDGLFLVPNLKAFVNALFFVGRSAGKLYIAWAL